MLGVWVETSDPIHFVTRVTERSGVINRVATRPSLHADLPNRSTIFFFASVSEGGTPFKRVYQVFQVLAGGRQIGFDVHPCGVLLWLVQEAPKTRRGVGQNRL